MWKDRNYVLWTLKEAERLGFGAIIVTCDHPHERVKGNTMPLFEPFENEDVYLESNREKSEGAPSKEDMHLGKTLKQVMTFPNLERYRRACDKDATVKSEVAGENDSELTFKDLAWICSNTTLPVVCKGVLTPEDAILAARAGCRGICVSNHGKRQMDASRVIPAMQALPRIVDVLRDRDLLRSYRPKTEMEDSSRRMIVLVDTGFRTGSQVLTALALGAHAVMIGRPVLWALAAGGGEGVGYVFDRLRQELRDEMHSAGLGSVEDIHKRGRDEILIRTSDFSH